MPSFQEGEYRLEFHRGPETEFSVWLYFPGRFALQYPLYDYPRIAELRTILEGLDLRDTLIFWEGRYFLARRNTRSDYFLAIQVSYPNKQDERRAHKKGWAPGGSIMIHGFPNSPRHPWAYYEGNDWTDGCIALSNSDMVEVWMRTLDNIPIDIYP